MINVVIVNLYGVIAESPFENLIKLGSVTSQDREALKQAERSYCFSARNLDYLAETYSLKVGLTREVVEAELKKPVSISPEFSEIFSALKGNNLKTVLLASMGEDMSGTLDSGQVKQIFDKTYLSFETGLSLPDPKVFKDLAKRLNVPVSQMLFIDIDASNLKVASSLGVQTLEFTNVKLLLGQIIQLLANASN
jgi:FMN phosphatase YigB (HAD superfamily)